MLVHSRSPKCDDEIRRGAYGLEILGLASGGLNTVPPDSDWRRIEIVSTTGEATVSADRLGTERAELVLGRGQLVIERALPRATYTTARPLSAEALVHPYLAPVAAVLAHWHRQQSFHAGAFAVDGAAWAVAGPRNAGKSSLLASLALAGVGVISDDVLVVREGSACAGPRAVDLRPEAAAAFGVGDPLGVVGLRERWRFPLEEIAVELPLRGWIFLAWDDRTRATPIGAGDRLRRIAAQTTLRVPAANAAGLLQLASLPAWEVSRPASWEAVDSVRQLVLDLPCR